MTELIKFTNEELGATLRTIKINDKDYFVANDVAKALGYEKPKDAITAHTKGAVIHLLLTKGGEQRVKFIPEADVYRLIFKSKLPSAEKFEAWVVEKVLPSIRKTGSYSFQNQLSIKDIKLYNECKAHKKTKLQLQEATETIEKIQPFIRMFADEFDAHQKTKNKLQETKEIVNVLETFTLEDKEVFKFG